MSEADQTQNHAENCNLWQDHAHHVWLLSDAARQLSFFRKSLRPDQGFYTLDFEGTPRDCNIQELHYTTRMVHSFALGKLAGFEGCDSMIDQGMRYLINHMRDKDYGGFVWALNGPDIHDGRKLAYGHVFVLLAAASAHAVGHPEGLSLLEETHHLLQERFWEAGQGRFCDEFNRDWTPFSTYRGMNANMHGVEALLSAYEVNGHTKYLVQAGQILDFFIGEIAAQHDWHLVEHYSETWQIDLDYSENPMFRPAGTTPGHSFEMARLGLQYWDLRGRPSDQMPQRARALIYSALQKAWDNEHGGFYYTLNFDGTPAIRARYWWPVTEAIGAVASLIKIAGTKEDIMWYARLWRFAQTYLVDEKRGGWFPELDENNTPTEKQFLGKPDIYHALQADLLPLCPSLSGLYSGLRALPKNAVADAQKTAFNRC